MPESPEEIVAEQKLDEVTRQVASQEMDKEVTRERSGFFGPFTFGFRGWPQLLRWKRGDPVPEPRDDPDQTSEEGLRDVLHEHDPKQ